MLAGTQRELDVRFSIIYRRGLLVISQKEFQFCFLASDPREAMEISIYSKSSDYSLLRVNAIINAFKRTGREHSNEVDLRVATSLVLFLISSGTKPSLCVQRSSLCLMSRCN